MADRSYLIEVLLQARDDTARAFASATGQLEAYNALIEEQKAKTASAGAANTKYVDELNKRTTSEKKLAEALKDSRIRNVEAADATLKLRDAQREVVKAESENDPVKRASALGRVTKAQNELVNALAEENKARRGWATVVANQIAQQAILQARLEQTAKQEAKDAQAAEKIAQDRLRSERQIANTIDSIRRDAERERQSVARSASQFDAGAARERIAREKQVQREIEVELRAAEQKAAAERRATLQREAEERRVALQQESAERKAAGSINAETERSRAARERNISRSLDQGERQDVKRRIQYEKEANTHILAERKAASQKEAEFTRITGRVESAARIAGRPGARASDVARAEREIESHRQLLVQRGHAPHEVDTAVRNIRQDVSSDYSLDKPPDQSGWKSFLNVIGQAKKEFSNLDTSTSGFTTHLRGAFGFAAVTLIQPIIALVVGLVAAFASLASAAVAAGGAIGTVFLSGIAQGIPVLGVFAVALQRLSGVFGLVSAQFAVQQQRFIAQFETAKQNALGINQVAIAEHNLSDSLYSQRQAVVQIGIAQLNLNETRLQATRQLQDLIFQETQARLAAEASSLAITNSQKALREAIATGGDVQGAQLQLAQARASHTQAITSAQRAITDARPGSLARQGIQETVIQGQQAVQAAKRAAIDAQYQVAQARASVVQAQQAAAGYNLATDAQLAYLRSQMSKTELSLVGSITRILGLFRGANAYMRPITDAILGAFVPVTNRIYQILKDPRIFGALRGLAEAIGGTVRGATRELTNQSAINGFISLIKAASQNIGPFAKIIVDLIKSAGSIAVTAEPFVHSFLLFITGIADKFASWSQSTQGKNWLKDFFDVAFSSLKAFIGLAISIGRLVLDVVGIGGGAQSGINILKDLKKWVDNTAGSIEHHGKVFKELHSLWSIALPTVRALGRFLGAVGGALLSLATSKQGQESFKNFVDLIIHILIPAFVQFVIIIGAVTNKITGFLRKHPELEKFLVTFIATAAALSIGFKALGLIFGPLSAIIGLIPKIAGLIKAFETIATLMPEIEGGMVATFLAPLVPIALLVAAIVGIAAVTGNMQNLLKTLAAPFVAAWAQIKKPLDDLGRQFTYFINGILGPFGIHVKNFGQIAHNVFAGLLSVVKFIFTQIGTVIGSTLGGIIKVITGIFEVLGAIVHGNFSKVVDGMKKIGTGMIQGLLGAIAFLPQLVVRIFIKLVEAILHFLGISSPSKKFHNIGQAMVDGLWNGLKAIGNFAAKILGWIGNGIESVIHWVTGLGARILRALWNGIVNLAKTYFNFERWLWGTIFNAVWGILKDVERLGERIVKAIVNGIKKAPKLVGDAIKSLIPQPLKDAANFVGGALPWNWNRGGAVPGYGGGDIVSSNLEPGEHVFTKEEVRAAGGHGALFAFRSSLGGGGQGGPSGYAQGGAVSGIPLSSSNIQNKTTQGVTGQLGGQLANIRQFIAQFTTDWKKLWDAINKSTIDNIKIEENFFTKFFKTIEDGWQALNNNLTQKLTDWWNNTNQNTQQQLNKLLFNFKFVYQKVDTDSFNAFWYIVHAANQALQAFGAKPATVKFGTQPTFAGGGWIGNAGERGRDGVHAMLGRGEAVLNYAHQAIVEPAMRAFYGFGLNKMFNRMGGEHAGGGMGYAAGGYVNPFPPGTVVGRADQGVDANMPVGSPIGPMGNAQVMGIIPNWYKGQPYIWWKLLDGIRAGAYAYVSEQITNLAQVGSKLKATDAVARYAPSGTGIEYGWATPTGATLARATSGYTEGQVTPAGADMRSFLGGLGHGKITGGGGQLGGPLGGLVGTVWNAIKEQTVKGSGVLAELMKATIGKVTGAANAFGMSQAGADTAIGGLGGPVARGRGYASALKWTQEAMKLAGVSGPRWLQMLLRQEFRESGYNPNAINNTDINAQRGDPSRGLLQTIGSTFRQYALPGFNKNIYDPISNIIAGIRYMISRYGGGDAARALSVMWGRGGGAYAGGGFVGNVVPILAHAGEWVVNQAQQSKLAGWLGTSRGGLKGALGFSGGPQSFAGGGEVVPLQPTIGPSGVIQDPASIEGAMNLPFVNRSVDIVSHAIALLGNIITNLRKSGSKFNKDLNTWLDNLTALAGDNGLLSIAAAALDDYISKQQVIVSLAANGIRIVNSALTRSKPERALQVATRDLQSTKKIGDDLEALQKREVSALGDVQQQINTFGKVTSANLAQYQRLIGLRKTITNQIADTDSKIAQNAQDIIDKQQTRFQAQLNQSLRGTGTVGSGTAASAIGGNFSGILGNFGKIGPQIALGLAQTAQTIAQTLGDPTKIGVSDQAVIQAATAQQQILQKKYHEAAAKAQNDPRWQKVADDLLSQLESATTTVAQAQAQALTDAISAQDTKSQIQTSILDIRNRLAQVIAGYGDNLTATAQQIQISRDRSGTLNQQIGAYQGLLSVAQSQGNVQAVNDLTQKINDLTAQVSEANLQTQQLITTYRQVSVSILQTQTQASSGFFSAANSIAQTLGAIAGNQNLPNLIAYAKAAASTLVTEGQKAVQNIIGVISDPNGPFGANQAGANGFLSQLTGAFNQGPQAFATMLASLAPQLSTFEAGLPSDQLTLFQGLVQALIDNATAVVTNTQTLQQLNATTNQQAFTSSAWTMFREAIFTGLGTLLPTYAMQVPGLDIGGTLMSSGLIYGHTGETITPANVARGEFGGGMNQTNHFNIDHPVEVADPVLFGNAVAWRLSHDPNSR